MPETCQYPTYSSYCGLNQNFSSFNGQANAPTLFEQHEVGLSLDYAATATLKSPSTRRHSIGGSVAFAPPSYQEAILSW
jgi:hypothetical protein